MLLRKFVGCQGTCPHDPTGTVDQRGMMSVADFFQLADLITLILGFNTQFFNIQFIERIPRCLIDEMGFLLAKLFIIDRIEHFVANILDDCVSEQSFVMSRNQRVACLCFRSFLQDFADLILAMIEVPDPFRGQDVRELVGQPARG